MYDQLEGVAKNQGNMIDRMFVSNLEECQKNCDKNERCKNVKKCGSYCYLYDKNMTEDEPHSGTSSFCVTTYQQKCGDGNILIYCLIS